MKVYQTKAYGEARKLFKEIAVQPGWTVFFWNKQRNNVDHIAIVIRQSPEKLNLQDAILLHGAPPGFGISSGLLSKPQDLSALRLATINEFLGSTTDSGVTTGYPHRIPARTIELARNLAMEVRTTGSILLGRLNWQDMYSGVMIGYPCCLPARTIELAGALAEEIGTTGLINGKPAVFAYPILNNLFFAANFDPLKRSLRVKSIHALRKRIGVDVVGTYCGDLIGRIYEIAGAKDLPKTSILGLNAYTSFKFYQWQKENGTLVHSLTWSGDTPG